MKAKDFNGTIKTYSQVPKTYKNILNFHLLSDSDLESHGFYDVHKPTFNENTQELGDIEWDSANSRFTYPVNNKTFSQTVAEMKADKIKSLDAIYNRKLSYTDWYVTRNAEKGTAIPSAITTERDNLRSEHTTKKAEINAKTTKAQVADYTLPSLID
jgi:hypothetical protein